MWAIDVATQRETILIQKAFNPDCSPDGKRIAFDASWAGPRRIWAVDRLGHNPQQLTSDVSEGISHVRPRWSPDGSRIVFQNIERTKFDVRVLDLANGKTNWITNDAVQDLNPDWSPTGRFIYFSSYRGGGINIWRAVMSPQGTNAGPPQQLTIGAGQDVQVAVSGNGKRLAFSILKQNADIWRLPVSPETGKPVGEPQELITTTREDSRGAWSPDAKMIAFNSEQALKAQNERLVRALERTVFWAERIAVGDTWRDDIKEAKAVLESLSRPGCLGRSPAHLCTGGADHLPFSPGRMPVQAGVHQFAGHHRRHSRVRRCEVRS